MNEYKTIEELKELKETDNASFEGMKAIMGWTKGKQVTEDEYDNALKTFNSSPINGR